MKPPAGLIKVIIASSVGTLIEWYDFYVFVSLGTILATQFFPGNSASGLFSVLAIFATGMIVRPFGAVVFGRMGDMVGRKHTFILTLLMMGACSTAIGLLPGYKAIGGLAPALLIVFRLIQGLALGGEYGGAATYVAENAPPDRRGFYTSFIQITATIGVLLSLLLILALRSRLGDAAFADWGWRIPFLLSSILVVFSYLVRRSMAESPLFAELKAKGTTSKNPLVESFTNPENRKKVLVALFGLTAGQGVVWHAGHLYSLVFLQSSLFLRMPMANQVVAWALVLGAPFFIVFGALSDRIGRKKIVMTGLALAVLCFVPIYGAMQHLISFDFHRNERPITRVTPISDSSGRVVSMTKTVEMTDDNGVTQLTQFDVDPTTRKPLTNHVPYRIEYEVPPKIFWMLVGLIWIQIVFATLVYAPMAAFLVEMFPTRIRYTSLSVPYHLGNGIFGGLVPLVSTWIVARTGMPFAGILYPTSIALMTLMVGMSLVKETRGPGAVDAVDQ